MRHLARKDFTWEGMDLKFQNETVCSLIPSQKYENHYHLKFSWREKETPEFFNIFNARENARIYSAQNVQERYDAEPVERFK